MKSSALFAAMLAGALATSASAETVLTGPSAGYTYFNRPGASLQDHSAAVLECHYVLDDVRYNRRTTTTSGPAGGWGVATAATVDAIANVQGSRRTYTAGIENCMVARGWRVVRLPASEGAALDTATPDALRAQLALQVGAETPTGEVVRAFNNDMQLADTVWSGRPRDLDVVSLSIQATAIPRNSRRSPDVDLPNRPPSALEPIARNPRGAARQPADATMIVLQLSGAGGLAPLDTLRFERIGPDPTQPAWVADRLPAGFEITMTGNRQTHIVTVPPGRWRITSITQRSGFDYGVYVTDFCLGAPSFEIAAGEVVYAGAFSQRGGFGPDMDMTSVQADLAVAPTIASRLRPASYVNGATYPCGGTYIYALEVQGAPFEPGYVGGSSHTAASTETTEAPALPATEPAPAPTP